MKPYAFGVDIGGTAIKLGLFRTDGTLIDKWQIPTRTQEKGKFILPDVLESIWEHMSTNTIVWKNVEGIGMGVPGPVGDDGTVFGCVNLGWDIFREYSATSNPLSCNGYRAEIGVLSARVFTEKT